MFEIEDLLLLGGLYIRIDWLVVIVGFNCLRRLGGRIRCFIVLVRWLWVIVRLWIDWCLICL